MWNYLPILFFLILATLTGVALIIASRIFGPKRPTAEKLSPYECGVPTVGTPRETFSVKFYLVAIFFILFDIEVAFFYPWALVFKKFLDYGPLILIEMAIFLGILAVGFLYLWKKGALDWE